MSLSRPGAFTIFRSKNMTEQNPEGDRNQYQTAQGFRSFTHQFTGPLSGQETRCRNGHCYYAYNRAGQGHIGVQKGEG